VTHHIDLAGIHLDTGSHPASAPEACLLEWVAIFAGLSKDDHPPCTSPVLGAFGRSWNDALPDETRQRLIPFIPRLVGTAGDPEADEVRAWMATDWLVRTFTPTWLRKAGLAARADELAALPELTSTELAAAAMPIIEATKKEAYAAWEAAREAAWEAARLAARAAAGAAAWEAAWEAAGAAAWEAARLAAREAAGAAAWAAAWEAARAAAGEAAGAAAWEAAWEAARAAAGEAAWAAARAAAAKKKGYSAQYDAAYKAARPILDRAFAETTAELAESAFDLFDRMIEVRSAVPA
jgi:hypothetical protein